MKLNIISLNSYRCILYALTALNILFTFLFGIDYAHTSFSNCVILMVNIYMVICSRNNILFLIITLLMLYCDYSIIYANYIYPLKDSLYVISENSSISTKAINILALFYSFLFCLFPWHTIKKLDFNIRNKFGGVYNKNIPLELFLLVILGFIFIFGVDWSLKSVGRMSIKPIYEYSVIIFILYFYYSGNSKLFEYLGFLFVVVFSLQNFILGGRIVGLQFVFVLYLFVYAGVISRKVLVIIGISFLFLFSIIGVVRESILNVEINISEILMSVIKNGFANDTSYSAYYTSECFLKIQSMFNEEQRMSLFNEFLKMIIWGENEYALPRLSFQYEYHNYGGILPYYLFFYMKEIGVLFCALFLICYLYLLKRVSVFTNGLFLCLAIYITSTFFRWYLYTPIVLLRGVLLLCISYAFTSFFHKDSLKISKLKEVRHLTKSDKDHLLIL